MATGTPCPREVKQIQEKGGLTPPFFICKFLPEPRSNNEEKHYVISGGGTKALA